MRCLYNKKWCEKGQSATDYLMLVGGAILIMVITITIIIGLSSPGGLTDKEHNAIFVCESHGLELIDFKDHYGKLKEVKCFQPNEDFKVFRSELNE